MGKTEWERVQELAKTALSMFVGPRANKALGNREVWTCNVDHDDDGPDYWVREMVEAAHDDCRILPDDFRYQFIVESLDAIMDCENEDDAEQSATEPDIYTHDLNRWLCESYDGHGYCDEAVTEGMVPETAPMFERLAAGQYLERREVFGAVLGYLQQRAEEENEG